MLRCGYVVTNSLVCALYLYMDVCIKSHPNVAELIFGTQQIDIRGGTMRRLVNRRVYDVWESELE